MVKKIAVLGIVSGAVLFLYGRKLLTQTQAPANDAAGSDFAGS